MSKYNGYIVYALLDENNKWQQFHKEFKKEILDDILYLVDTITKKEGFVYSMDIQLFIESK